MLLEKVVVSSYNYYVQGSGVGLIVKLESMKESLKAATWNCNIVNMLPISLVLGGCVTGGSKKVMKGGVRDDYFGPVFRVWSVATFTGWAEVCCV